MIVSNVAQYISVVDTRIGRSQLILGGEVDACKRFPTEKVKSNVVILFRALYIIESSHRHGSSGYTITDYKLVWDSRPTRPEDPINWVELKTSFEITSQHESMKYQRKLFKFWIQSFILGVPKIIVGFRNRAGILRKLEELETNKIPNSFKHKGKVMWDCNISLNFTAAVLECWKPFLR